MSIEVLLWSSREGSEVEGRSFRRPLELTPDGDLRAVAHDAPAPDGVLLVRLDGSSDACAAVLVPRQRRGSVRRNGLALDSGLHLLGHRDRLDVAGLVLWVSLQTVAEVTVYDPEILGPDCFCFRTKQRIEPGEEIVICPGTPGLPCDVPYRVSAWKAGTRCHNANCGFDPREPAWKPVAPGRGSQINALLELAGG